MVGKNRNTQIFFTPVTYVPRGTSSKVKTLGSPAASWRACEQRTSTWGTHNLSWGRWPACIAGLLPWLRDHSSYSGGDHAYPYFEEFSYWPDRCEAISWVVHLRSLADNELCRPTGLVILSLWICSRYMYEGRPENKGRFCIYLAHVNISASSM